MFQITDSQGNRLVLEDSGLLRLYLASGPRRNLGTISGGVWYVTREKYGDARGRGHWLHAGKCWMLNWHVLNNAAMFGFSVINFTGYDGEDNLHRILRSVTDCLKQKLLNFKQQGFELQIAFSPDAKAEEAPPLFR